MGGPLVEGVRPACHRFDGEAEAVIWSVNLRPAHGRISPQLMAGLIAGDLDAPCRRSNGSSTIQGVGGVEGALTERLPTHRVDLVHPTNPHWQKPIVNLQPGCKRGVNLPLIDGPAKAEIGMGGIAERHCRGPDVPSPHGDRQSVIIQVVGQLDINRSRPARPSHDPDLLGHRGVGVFDEVPR